MTKKETGHERCLRLIRQGECAACGKRKPRKGHRDCKMCADYYAGWAKKTAKRPERKAAKKHGKPGAKTTAGHKLARETPANPTRG